MFRNVFATATFMTLCLTMPAARSQNSKHDRGEIRHVLLISIDGMHALDYLDCANGISTINGGTPYCPNLAALAKNGINYLDATTSKPSDSFPGLTALVSGGSPRTYHGRFLRRGLRPLA
jgi:predicted AlkP superfamily pyrophosphatase or phosphodiesterase